MSPFHASVSDLFPLDNSNIKYISKRKRTAATASGSTTTLKPILAMHERIHDHVAKPTKTSVTLWGRVLNRTQHQKTENRLRLVWARRLLLRKRTAMKYESLWC